MALAEIRSHVRGERVMLEFDVIDNRPVKAGVKFDPLIVGVTIYAPDGTTKVVDDEAASMKAVGIYQYTWPSLVGSVAGRYTASAKCTYDGGASVTINPTEEAFDLLTK